MSAEAQAWLEEAVEPTAPAGGRQRSAQSCPAESRSASGKRTDRTTDASHRSSATSAWNVLAEEIVSFPRPVHRLLLGLRSEADLGSQPEGGRASEARSNRARVNEGPALSYGEQWLERELLSLQYRADQGYPEPADERWRPSARQRSVSAHGEATGHREGASTSRSQLGRNSATALAGSRVSEPLHRSRQAQLTARALPVGRTSAALATAPIQARAVRSEPRGLRRLLPGAATLAVLVGMWAGFGALSAAHQQRFAVLPGSVRTPSGYLYVVKPGDTLWSIASRLEPGGDPRLLVAQLQSELHGATLDPGARLVLP